MNWTEGKNTIIERMNLLGGAGEPFLFILDYACRKPLIIPLREVDPQEICFEIKGFSNFSQAMEAPGSYRFEAFPETFSVYKEKFDKVQDQIRLGNTYLINLTCSTPVQTDLSLEEIFGLSRAKYKLWIRDTLVVFSPECFVRIKDGMISSYPMKGTIDATMPGAYELLKNDPKEIAEHYTITDLIRNDLNRVAAEVRVDRFRYMERLETNRGPIIQASSQISGRLPDDYCRQVGTILYSLLPAGSVTGAPKEKTVEILHVEDHERNYYTGVFGIFDGRSLESAVMIRYIEKTEKGLVYKSGGGITSFSRAEKEYAEMVRKIYLPM